MKAIYTAVKRLFRTFGLDVRYFKHTEEGILKNLLRTLQPVAVLDVGANIGQYGKMLRAAGYRDLIISFEALNSAHEQLTEEASGDPKWIVAPRVALGSDSRTTQINVAENSVSSSLLPMRGAHLEAAPESRYLGRQTITVERLDGLVPSLLAKTGDIFLKIDTQGYEEEVLNGAHGILPRISGIQLELSLVQLYESAPTFLHLIRLLESLGYEFFQIIPGFTAERTGRLLQIDGVFVRKEFHG